MNRIASLGHRIAALAIVSLTSFTIMLVRHFILLHEGPSDLRKTAAVIRPLWSPPCVARVNFQLSYIYCIYTPAISSVHCCSATFIHLGLLLGKSPQLFLELPALGYHTRITATLTRMNLQQCPNTAANSAAALYTCHASRSVLQQILCVE